MFGIPKPDGDAAAAQVEPAIFDMIKAQLRDVITLPSKPAENASEEDKAKYAAKVKARDQFFQLTGEYPKEYRLDPEPGMSDAELQTVRKQTDAKLNDLAHQATGPKRSIGKNEVKLNTIQLNNGGTLDDLIPTDDEIKKIKGATKSAVEHAEPSLMDLIAGMIAFVIGMVTSILSGEPIKPFSYYMGEKAGDQIAGEMEEELKAGGVRENIRAMAIQKTKHEVMRSATGRDDLATQFAPPAPEAFSGIDQPKTVNGMISSQLNAGLTPILQDTFITDQLPALKDDKAKGDLMTAMTAVLSQQAMQIDGKDINQIATDARTALSGDKTVSGLMDAKPELKEIFVKVAAAKFARRMKNDDTAQVDGGGLNAVMDAVRGKGDIAKASEQLTDAEKQLVRSTVKSVAAEKVAEKMQEPGGTEALNAAFFMHNGGKPATTEKKSAYREAVSEAAADILTTIKLNTPNLEGDELKAKIEGLVKDPKYNFEGKPLLQGKALEQFAKTVAEGYEALKNQKAQRGSLSPQEADAKIKAVEGMVRDTVKEVIAPDVKADKIEAELRKGAASWMNNAATRAISWAPSENDYKPMAKAISEELNSIIPELASKRITKHGELGIGFVDDVKSQLKKKLQERIDRKELSKAWGDGIMLSGPLNQIVDEAGKTLQARIDQGITPVATAPAPATPSPQSALEAALKDGKIDKQELTGLLGDKAKALDDSTKILTGMAKEKVVLTPEAKGVDIGAVITASKLQGEKLSFIDVALPEGQLVKLDASNDRFTEKDGAAILAAARAQAKDGKGIIASDQTAVDDVAAALRSLSLPAAPAATASREGNPRR